MGAQTILLILAFYNLTVTYATHPRRLPTLVDSLKREAIAILLYHVNRSIRSSERYD